MSRPRPSRASSAVRDSYRVLRGLNYPNPDGPGELRHESGEVVTGLPLSADQLAEQVSAGVLALEAPAVAPLEEE